MMISLEQPVIFKIIAIFRFAAAEPVAAFNCPIIQFARNNEPCLTRVAEEATGPPLGNTRAGTVAELTSQPAERLITIPAGNTSCLQSKLRIGTQILPEENKK